MLEEVRPEIPEGPETIERKDISHPSEKVEKAKDVLKPQTGESNSRVEETIASDALRTVTTRRVAPGQSGSSHT